MGNDPQILNTSGDKSLALWAGQEIFAVRHERNLLR